MCWDKYIIPQTHLLPDNSDNEHANSSETVSVSNAIRNYLPVGVICLILEFMNHLFIYLKSELVLNHRPKTIMIMIQKSQLMLVDKVAGWIGPIQKMLKLHSE